jgi:hypothetical protein
MDNYLSAKCEYARVVQKVRGQLRVYHFNWVNIYIPYTKMFVVKFQFKIKWNMIILVSLNKKIAVLKTPGRCARAKVKMLQSLRRSVLI